jgi:hypothetical protein
VVGMIVAAEQEQRGAKVAFMIPSYILTKVSSIPERETLKQVLNQVIDINEIAAAVASCKDTLIQDVRNELKLKISQMDLDRTLRLCLMRNQEEVAQTFIFGSKNYGKVLLAFLNNESYEGKTVQTIVIVDTLEVLQKVILNFYTSWNVKKAISKALDRISVEKIKKTVETINPYQGNSKEVADKIYQLLKRYEITGSSGAIVDDAFRGSLFKILAECGLYTTISTVVTLVVTTLFSNIAHIAIGNVFPVLIPVIIAVLGYQIFTFRENLANKVSEDVSRKVGIEFSSFNLEISKNIKSQIIKNICSL